MKELDLEYKIIGQGENVLVIETGIGGSFYDWYPIIQEIIVKISRVFQASLTFLL